MQEDREINTDKEKTIIPYITVNDYFRRMSKGYLLLFIVLPLIYIFLIILNYVIIYDVTSENIRYDAETTLLEYSVELDDFLYPALSAMESMSYNVEDLFRTDSGNEDIEKYLIRESEALDSISDIVSNGIYGYIHGEYLDGSQWVPDEDFVPSDRPWYKEALKNEGRVTYVEPYVDSMTGNKVMTITKLLSDGESVICIDIRMDEIQEITESLVKHEDNTGFVIVMDDEGAVIAHSDPEEVGKNYLLSDTEPGHTLAEKLLLQGEQVFSVNDDIVYSRKLGGGWYLLSVTGKRKMYSRLFYTLFNTVVIGILGTLIILYVLSMITRKRMEIRNYIIDLKSASSIYICMYKVDLDDDHFVEISCKSPLISSLVGGRRSDARKLMAEIINIRIDERNKKDMLEFSDLETLKDRLIKTDTIALEFMNAEMVWKRARFTVAERNTDGGIKSVLFMVEDIDEEKKSRDRLLYLSETDSLTGINNRGSGESKVKSHILNGDGGMFMLLDVDKFKNINDTYGHDIGDKVLIAIAGCLKKTFRSNDVVMRLGGDEFAAFAPSVFSRSGGELMIRRFLNQIEEIRIEEMKGKGIKISMGVAFYRPDDSFTFEELYKRADRCTYESKINPGSRVTYYDNMEGI